MPVIGNDSSMDQDSPIPVECELGVSDEDSSSQFIHHPDGSGIVKIEAEPDVSVPVGAIISDNDEIRFCSSYHESISKHPGALLEFKDTNVEARRKELSLLSLGKKLLDMCKQGRSAEVKQLMIDGAPFIADWVGTSPLHYSVLNKHVEVTELLLKAGICRDAKNKVDRTPLHVAAHMGCAYMVKLLLTFGADVNCTDMLSMTPLHWVAESGDLLTAKILLDYGADTTSKNKFGKTPYALAMRGRHVDVAKAIKDVENADFDSRMLKVAHLRQKMVGSNRVSMKPVAEILEPSPVSTEGAIKLLKSHGVTMIEPDKDTVISSAILNGHTIRLTDAGKLAFKSLDGNSVGLINSDIPTTGTGGNDTTNEIELPVNHKNKISPEDTEPPPAKIPRLLTNGQVMHKVSAQQLIEMKKENKIVIKAVVPGTCVVNIHPSSSTNSPISATNPIPDKGTGTEDVGERNMIYLQRLETKASECKRQVEALQKQCKIKEEEYAKLEKQINLFKACSQLK